LRPQCLGTLTFSSLISRIKLKVGRLKHYTDAFCLLGLYSQGCSSDRSILHVRVLIMSANRAQTIAMVFGASGGLGRSLSAQIEGFGHFDRVIPVSRSSKPSFDLLEEASIQQTVEAASENGAIRLALDATGFLHDGCLQPEKSFRQIDRHYLSRSFAVNAIGPALLMKHLLPAFPRQGRAVFATLSARVGSVADNRLGGWFGYRASKAALNQMVRTAAIELRRYAPEAICVALHPGTVETELSRPFAKSGLDVQSSEEAAHNLLSVIDGLSPEDSGGFFDHRGETIPW